MAAARVGNYKLIRVDHLGECLYNLEVNPQETENLAQEKEGVFESLSNQLISWEEGLTEPLWTEGATWDTITWLIHQDLFLNREVRVKEPAKLRNMRTNR